jgi:4-hydroxybenzoate polyprenyltransferase
MIDDELDTDDDSDDLEEHLHFRNVSTLRSYIELMRLPNVFTAMADVAMGFLFAQASDWHWVAWWDSWTLALLLAASSLLYISGIVLNDVFDLEIDRNERPERPLPSGRVSLASARWLGWRTLTLGVVLGTAAGFFTSHTGHLRPGIVAALLATCIVLYDAWLKRTPVGPLAMGACRMLNVLMGMNAVDAPLMAENWLVAGGIGVYVAGITWFARREADESSRLQLTLATVVMVLGVALLAWFPSWSDRVLPLIKFDPQRWYLLTGALGLLIVWRCVWAVIEPTPVRVRIAVAQAVLSIIMLDAVACYAVRGMPWAMLILLLLAPAMFLGRWIKTT